MYATASLETRKALTSKWDGLKRMYDRYNELNNQNSRDLRPEQKRELEKLRRDICLLEFDRVESPALRIQKFVHIGDNTKRFECDALADVSKKYFSQLDILAKRFQFSAKIPGEIRFMLKLQDRMIVNHTGGILENAGICLHPNAGIPYIPGSAIKGVARHAAWCRWADAMDAGDEKAAKDVALKIALTFGFPTNDKKGLDAFCKEKWPEWFGEKCLFETLAGLFAFMPVMPAENLALVTDIVNGHHSKYYQDKQKKPLGNERPNPQFFPAVEKGAMFSFIIRPLRRCESVLDTIGVGITKKELCEFAESVLRSAAEDFGFGSKTSNGYGWFSEDKAKERELEEQAEKAKQAEAERRMREQKEAELRRSREEKKAKEQELAQLPPKERAEAELKLWKDGKWNSVLHNLNELLRLEDEQKGALVRLLATTEKARWEQLKKKALSGKKKEKKAAQPVLDEIYRTAKNQTPKVKMP